MKLCKKLIKASLSNPNFLNIMLHPIDITIGFDPGSYTVDEDEGFSNFMVVLVHGILARDIVAEFYTESGSAIGKDCNTVEPL